MPGLGLGVGNRALPSLVCRLGRGLSAPEVSGWVQALAPAVSAHQWVNKACLSKTLNNNHCICGPIKADHEHVFFECMFVTPLLRAFRDLCDHLHYGGEAQSMEKQDFLLGTISGKPILPGLLLFLFEIRKLYWIEFCACKYGENTQFQNLSLLWKEITRRTENRLNAFIGECTIEIRKILYSAGRGDPELREHRLNKYVLPKWNSKISPLGKISLDLSNDRANFEPNIEFFKIATLLEQ